MNNSIGYGLDQKPTPVQENGLGKNIIAAKVLFEEAISEPQDIAEENLCQKDEEFEADAQDNESLGESDSSDVTNEEVELLPDPDDLPVENESSDALRVLGQDGSEREIDVEDGLPIYVYADEDLNGETRYRCDVPQQAVGHAKHVVSDAVAQRGDVLAAMAKWLEGNRQKFLCSFDIKDLGADSDEKAYKEMVDTFKANGCGCVVTQKGLLEKIGFTADKGGKEANFSRYKRIGYLCSNDLGKQIELDVLFSAEAKYEWAAAAIRGFINKNKEVNESKAEYLSHYFEGRIQMKNFKSCLCDPWESNVTAFIRSVISLLSISYAEIEVKIK